MNIRKAILVSCCLAFLPAYAQHIPTLEEVVNEGLVITKGESRVNWLSDGSKYSKKKRTRREDMTSCRMMQPRRINVKC